MDAVQQANSGHPGAPMGMAEMAVAPCQPAVARPAASSARPCGWRCGCSRTTSRRCSCRGRSRQASQPTHDSIGLGEGGPTQQAVAHAASLRLIPNLEVGVTRSWSQYGCAAALGVGSFGESAPAPQVYQHFGLTTAALADLVQAIADEDPRHPRSSNGGRPANPVAQRRPGRHAGRHRQRDRRSRQPRAGVARRRASTGQRSHALDRRRRARADAETAGPGVPGKPGYRRPRPPSPTPSSTRCRRSPTMTGC